MLPVPDATIKLGRVALPPAGGNVFGYLRRSSGGQSYSLDTQMELIGSWATSRGVQVDDYFRDSVTGGLTMTTVLEGTSVVTSFCIADRPGLLSMLRRPRPSMVVAVRRDRLSRNVEGNRALARVLHPAPFVVVDSFASDPLLDTIVDAFSERELSLLKTRVNEGLETARREDRRTGMPALGVSCSDGKLSPNQNELAAVQLMVKLAAEDWGARRIAGELNRRHHADPSTYQPRGEKWHATTVARTLERIENHG